MKLLRTKPSCPARGVTPLTTKKRLGEDKLESYFRIKKIGLWGIGLIPALVLLALFFSGPMDLARNIEGPGQIVPAGGRIRLNTGPLPGWWQRLDLQVRCEPNQDCTVLRAGFQPMETGQLPNGNEKNEVLFRLRINNPQAYVLELINTGHQALAVKGFELRNYSLIGTGFPRFGVLLSPFPREGFFPFYALLWSLGTALLLIGSLVILGRRSQSRLNRGIRWVSLLFPWFLLSLGLVLWLKGMHLLLSQEAIMFTIFPGYFYLGLTSRFFKTRALVPLLVFLIAATLLILLGTVLGVGLSVRGFGPPYIYQTHFTRTSIYAGLTYLVLFFALFRKKKEWFSPGDHAFISSMLWVFFPTLIIYLANGFSDYGGDTTFNSLLSWRIVQGEGLIFSKEYVAAKGSWGLLPIGEGFLPTFPIGPGFLGLPTALIQYYWSAEPVDHLIAWNQKVTAAWVAGLSAAVIFQMIYLLGRKLWLSLLLTAAFALGTWQPTISAAVLWQHGPSVLLICLGLFLLVRGQKENPSFYPLAALPLAFLPLMRTQAVLFYLAGLVSVILLQPRWVYKFFLWSIPGIVATLWINLGLYHSLLGGYAYQASGDNFATPLLEGIMGSLFSPNRGLLVFSPFLILGFIGGGILWIKRSAVALAFGSAALLFFLVHAKYAHWHGGWCVAPRFSSELLPVLVFFGVFWFLEFRKIWAKVAGFLLIGFSIAINLPGSFFLSEQGLWNLFPNVDNYREERVWDYLDWLPFHYRYWLKLEHFQEVPAFPFVVADEVEPLRSEAAHYRVKVNLGEKPLEIIRMNNVPLREGPYQLIFKGDSHLSSKTEAEVILGYVGYKVEETSLPVDILPSFTLSHIFEVERAGRVDIRLKVYGKGTLVLDTVRIVPVKKSHYQAEIPSLLNHSQRAHSNSPKGTASDSRS
jgi:hypothetical protein